MRLISPTHLRTTTFRLPSSYSLKRRMSNAFIEPPLPKPSDIKLIMTDVDGTFLTDAHDVHPRTRSAIEYIRKNRPDIQVAIATGKQRSSCAWFIEELGFDESPAASCHGCVLHGPRGAVVKTTAVGNEVGLMIVEEVIKLNKTCFLFTVDEVNLVYSESGAAEDWGAIASKYDRNTVDQRGTDFLDRVRANEVEIIKVTIPLDVSLAPTVLAHLLPLLPPHVRATRALPFVIEVLPKSIDKSVALRYFCKMLGCKEDQVLAFGDGENDVEMLREAGFGVSMANAMEEPKKVAKYRTLSNNEGV